MDIQEFISKLGVVFEDTDLTLLKPETDFHKLDEWSSLSALSLIALVDEEFGKEIDGTDIRNAKTIEDLYKLIIK